jgi:serpin B
MERTLNNVMNTSTTAINILGLELLALNGKPDENAILSPYSIQSALVIAYAGADGITKVEMAKALHYNPDETELHLSFAALQQSLEGVTKRSAVAKQIKRHAPGDPITIAAANRLFGQKGFDFHQSFLSLATQNYNAPFEPLDFSGNPTGATATINRWVEDQTHQRIRNILPPGAVNKLTRLALVNAIYLKARWEERFKVESTRPLPFHLPTGEDANVPTMVGQRLLGYLKKPGMTMLDLRYSCRDLYCIIFLPDLNEGLLELERHLNSEVLDEPLPLVRRDPLFAKIQD